jgi:sterol desaturase/sphingolipid hydroxylase (fatty acid hydroxylase superfamily)
VLPVNPVVLAPIAATLPYIVFAALLLAERWRPHHWRSEAGDRWLTNAALFLLAGLTGTVLLPGGLTGFGEHAAPTGPVGLAGEALLALLAFDFAGYWEHRLFHRSAWLWRAHRVHHSDSSVDVTTSVRHHPFEVALTASVGAMLVALAGVSVASLVLALLVSRLAAVYTHSSLDLPAALDRPLRLFLVTPSVHRLHHSRWQPQTDSNYAAVFTVWDRLFGTYRDPAREPLAALGLAGFDGEDEATLVAALTQPFRRPAGASAAAAADAA